MKAKKTLTLIGVVLALFAVTALTSCNSAPAKFSVTGYYRTDSPDMFPDGYYVFYITTAPEVWASYIDSSVFYPQGDHLVGNMWSKNCKAEIEDALNSELFHEFYAAWDDAYFLCLNKDPQ